MNKNKKKKKNETLLVLFTCVIVLCLVVLLGIFLWDDAALVPQKQQRPSSDISQSFEGQNAVAGSQASDTENIHGAGQSGGSDLTNGPEQNPEENPPEKQNAGTETSPDPESSSETEPLPETQVVTFTISAVGDVTLGREQKSGYANSFDEVYDQEGADYFLQNVRDIFAADDMTIVNLEGTLTNSEDLRVTKQYNFKGRPEYVNILSNSAVEAVMLGNNHIMDFNSEGVRDTIRTVEDAGLAYALNTQWGNYYGMFESEKGIKVGFVSVNEYYEHGGVYAFLKEGYQKLREDGADLMLACMHWGGDKVYELEDAQYEIGHWCIDYGYDLVLGCHPHVIQGIECYNGKYIVYSMGNFCYGGNRNPKDKDSMIFQQTFTFVDGKLQVDDAVRAIPCRLSSVTNRNDYCPVALEGEEAAKVIDKLNLYSKEFGLVFDEEGYLIK